MQYLSCPYSSGSRLILEAIVRLATIIAGRLIKEGRIVYSPLTHSHPINEVMEGRISWETWLQYDEYIIENCCKKVSVIRIPGWETSKGVTREIRFAKSHGIEVDFIDATPEELVCAGITN